MVISLAHGGSMGSASLDARIQAARDRVRSLQAKTASIEAEARRAKRADQKFRVHPELETNDHEFFKKDYSSDGRPDIQSHFGHPYPEIQDSDDYDSDYVKDENHDNGHYDAQMAYDRLRTLKRNEEASLRDAAKKAAREAQAARDRAGASGKAAAKAAAGEDPAKAAREADVTSQKLAACKSDLEAALKKLAELMEEKAEVEEGKAKAEAALVPLKKKLETLDKKVTVLRKDLTEHQNHHSDLVKDLDSSKAELRKEEDALKKALAKLRKFRNTGLDKNSEIYDGHMHSRAEPATNRVVVAVTLLLSFWVALR